MINSSKDIGELINQLETPLGRANAVVDLSKQYSVPEENVREAIATFERVYDTEELPEPQRSWQDPDVYKNKAPLKTAATLARQILWIEKSVDLMAKAGEKASAAKMAEEFGFDQKAFELYKEINRSHDAIKLAEKLGLSDEYIALCQKNREHAKAINKCLELKREEEAKDIFRKKFESETKYGDHEKKDLVKLVKRTDLAEFAISLCREKDKPYLLAQIAAGTDQPELAIEYFEKTGHFLEGARHCVRVSKSTREEIGSFFLGEANRLYDLAIAELEKKREFAKVLEIAKEKIGDDKKILETYIALKQFEEGAKYFEAAGKIDYALLLLEKAGMLGHAQILAQNQGRKDKVQEYRRQSKNSSTLAQVAIEEGNFPMALAHYRAAIEKEIARNAYDWGADKALKVAEYCREQGQEDFAAEFEEKARRLYMQEAEKDEKEGQWESAAKNAKKAGNEEKAELYLQIDTIKRAYHKP